MNRSRSLAARYIYLKKGGKGYQVILPDQKVQYFSFDAYSGWEKALTAAMQYRDEHAPPAYIHRASKLGPKHTVGVTRATLRKTHKKNGKTYTYYRDVWIAQWFDKPRHLVSRSFSVDLYGEEKAKALALKARAEGLKKRGY